MGNTLPSSTDGDDGDAIPTLPTLDQLADGTAVEADDDDLWTSAPVSAAYVTTETYQPAVLTPAFFDPDTADPEDDDPSVRDDHPWWLRKLETIAPRPRPLDIGPEADPTHPARRYAWWSPFVHLTAGAAAGLASRTITAPLSVTRIHLQLTNEPVKSHWPSHFPGVASSLRSIYQEHGFPGLYRGNLVACLRLVPHSGIKFGVFEALKRERVDEEGLIRLHERVVFGSVAGLTAAFVTYPLDLLKAHFSVCPPAPVTGTGDGIATAVQCIVREEGMRGLYRGLSVTALGAVFYDGVLFASYETLKSWWVRDTHPLVDGILHTSHLSFPHHFVFGAVAGYVARTISYPTDLIRRRLQVMSPRVDIPLTREMSASTVRECVRETLAREGPLALWRGQSVNRWIMVPSSAITFSVYEQVKLLINRLGQLYGRGDAAAAYEGHHSAPLSEFDPTDKSL